MDDRLAARLGELRHERGWSLDDLSARSGISRATLSRLENGTVSPTASVLGKLCSAYALTMSRLMAMVETDFAPLIRRDDQPVWHDERTGFVRRSVSPPSESLAGEMLECSLEAGVRIEYEAVARPGLEHHLVLQEGRLHVTVADQRHTLETGDCLRYQLHGDSVFETDGGTPARYLLAVL